MRERLSATSRRATACHDRFVIDLDAAFFDLDLDALHRRRGVKWSRYPADVLPAWVADMDFPVAPPIRAALEAALARGDVGYPPDHGTTGVPEAYSKWARRWGFTFDLGLTHLMPDVVKSIEHVIAAFTRPGDAIVVNTPVYPPFLSTVRHADRALVENPLSADGSLDLDHLAEVFVRHRPRMVLLCSPHNPSGRVLRRRELEAIVALAVDHDALIVSDEIHGDLVHQGAHVPIASLSAAAAARTITLVSASKAFNVAGLRCALVIAGTPEVHRALLGGSEVARDAVGSLGIEAALAAWSPAGEEWLRACLAVLATNRTTVATWAAANGLGHHPSESTYLAWFDCRPLELGTDPARWFLDHARVALSPGPDFGGPGEGHARLNFATSPAILDQILDRLGAAIDRHRGSAT
jgi:cystathionine beta-lyase